MNETTKKQFDELKAKNPDAVLLFRVGDFYETYEDDAVTVSDVLGITLTKRGGTRMAGFPHHALDTYLPKLVRAGQRVAICDQLSETPAQEPKTSQTLKPTNMERKIQEISLNEIRPSAMNPRKTFDQESLQELADNIKRQGLLQPITIRPVDELLNTDGTVCHYEVVCGERRYRAVKMNGSKTISCIVREMTDEDAFDAMITENPQRKDVDPMEESFAFAQLVKNGKTIEEIALRFGKSKRFIADRIRLDKLLPELKKAVTDGGVTIGAGMLLAKLDEEVQKEFLDDWVPDPDEPITKPNVEEFLDDRFMKIERAPWSEDFEGSCGCTCEKCQFNNSNVGCLFYEMKVAKENANCTNREKFEAKRLAWYKHLIDEEADVLVKKDCELETGKTIIGKLQLYGGAGGDYQELLNYGDEKGFRIVDVLKMFNRWSTYREDDERLQEKLAKNEVFRVLVIESDVWNNTRVYTRFYEVANVRNADNDERKAMDLVRQYKENISRHGSTVAKQFRKAVEEYDVNAIDNQMLTDNELKILCILLLRHLGYETKKSIIGTAGDEVEYMERNNPSDVQETLIREYFKHELSDSSVEYWEVLQKAQAMLVDEWGIDAVDVRAKAAEKLAKKQEPIEKELLALGYSTEGKKLEF